MSDQSFDIFVNRCFAVLVDGERVSYERTIEQARMFSTGYLDGWRDLQDQPVIQIYEYVETAA